MDQVFYKLERIEKANKYKRLTHTVRDASLRAHMIGPAHSFLLRSLRTDKWYRMQIIKKDDIPV